MFLLNFKKDWNMHKSLLISFFLISIVILAIITGFYFVVENVTFSHKTESIVRGIWGLFSGIAALLGVVLPFVLMIFVLKADLGKRNVHNTLFAPQSVFAWYLPKVVFVFIVQGLFAFIQFGYQYLLFNSQEYAHDLHFSTSYYLNTFLAATFSLTYFGIITLSMAVYYSFRSKGLKWTFIGLTILSYFVCEAIYGIILFTKVSESSGGLSEALKVQNIWTQYGIESGIGVIFILIALYLFNKKVEY